MCHGSREAEAPTHSASTAPVSVHPTLPESVPAPMWRPSKKAAPDDHSRLPRKSRFDHPAQTGPHRPFQAHRSIGDSWDCESAFEIMDARPRYNRPGSEPQRPPDMLSSHTLKIAANPLFQLECPFPKEFPGRTQDRALTGSA